MAISALTTWIAGQVLTAAALNAERDNIINAGIALISPSTGDFDVNGNKLLNLGAGTVGALALYFSGDTDTGLYHSAANTLDTAVGGVRSGTWGLHATGTPYVGIPVGGTSATTYVPGLALTQDADTGFVQITSGTLDTVVDGVRVLQASAYTSATNYVRVSPSQSGTGPLIDVAGADTNIDLRLGAKGSGIIKAATGFQPAALVSSPPTANTLYQQNIVKGWIKVGVTANIQDSFNVSSVTDVGTGKVRVSWDTDLLNASYSVHVSIQAQTAQSAMIDNSGGGGIQAAGLTEFLVTDTANSAADPVFWHAVAIGRQ